MLVAAALPHASAAQLAELRIERSRESGLATFVTAEGGGPIAMAPEGSTREQQRTAFLERSGHLFGVISPESQLRMREAREDALGQLHTTYQQYERGIPVFTGVLKVHQDAQGSVLAANGHFRTVRSTLSTEPSIGVGTARATARGRLPEGDPVLESSELVIVDPGWYGDPPAGERLAYYLVLVDLDVPLREAFLVDAHSGEVLDQWNLLHTLLDRAIYSFNGSLPGMLIRPEGAGPSGSASGDALYDYGADVYNYFDRAFGRDGYDDAGATMIMTTDYPVVNAFWMGTQTTFHSGLATDDIAGHEWTHAVVEHTAGLIYQNESGQLNESYADVFGELIDLFNGDVAFAGPPVGPSWPTHPTGPGTDTPNGFRSVCSPIGSGFPDGVRWLMGEDANAPPLVGPIRDLWDPTCFSHPDRVSSPFQTCDPWDNGGVHSGSGIPNHAFAMLTDGKTFNGQTVTPIGPIKAAAVWYRALLVYLTPASSFVDAYFALNQAANDLIGTAIADPRPGGFPLAFSALDASQVDNALLAVEMNTGPACPGSCCDALAGVCQDNVSAASCTGNFSPGALCSSLSPPCSTPGSGARMIVLLDRSASMQTVRPSTGNTRCEDALARAMSDVASFFAGQPSRRASVWTFSGVGATQITSGFVIEADAQNALNALVGVPCSGASPLADAICTAAAAFPGGLALNDKVLSINSAGVENGSSGACSGPASLIGPPPPGNYVPGSWQANVWNTLQGLAVVRVRHWDVFGTPAWPPVAPDPLSVGVFFQDLAGSNGGSYTAVGDDDPTEPIAVPLLSLWGAIALILIAHAVSRARSAPATPSA